MLCRCDAKSNIADVRRKVITSLATELIACFNSVSLPACRNHNSRPQAVDCACAKDYIQSVAVSFVAKGGTCSWEGITGCINDSNNTNCAYDSYCTAGLCKPCSSHFEGCRKCDTEICLEYTDCNVPYAMEGDVCCFCTGIIKGGKCDTSEKISGWNIAGIIIGVLVVVGTAIGGVCYMLLRKKHQ